MAIPTAKFSFVTNGLTVFLKDTSVNTPTSWLWEFGDGSSSNLQNPNHTYVANGSYEVEFSATNADGTSVYTYSIDVNESNTISTDDILLFEAPSSLTIDENRKNYLLTKWRLYLQSAFEIDPLYLMDESKYSQLQVILIAKLVIYDLIMREAYDYLYASIGGGDDTNGASGGNVKKIETGPSSAEWYSGSKTLAEIFTSSPGGSSIFTTLTADICSISSKVGVKLPMCNGNSLNPVVPLKAGSTEYINTHTFLSKYYENH